MDVDKKQIARLVATLDQRGMAIREWMQDPTWTEADWVKAIAAKDAQTFLANLTHMDDVDLARVQSLAVYALGKAITPAD